MGGGLVSSVGTWLLTVAVPAQVLQAAGSLRDPGLTLAAEYLPQLLLGPVAGVAADRWDRRLMMAASSAASAAAVAVMLLGTAPGRYWVLYIALAAEAGTAVFYTPAIQARPPVRDAIPDLVPVPGMVPRSRRGGQHGPWRGPPRSRWSGRSTERLSDLFGDLVLAQ